MDSWSVIGLMGQSTNAETRRVVYHEAVQWFTSGFEVEAPIWFAEGLAEVYSTFEAKDGKAIWGAPLQDNADFLAVAGIQSMRSLLRASTFTGQHRASWYYPQSWLFLHYLMYGDGGVRRSRISYRDMELSLERYLAGGRFRKEETVVRDRSDEMQLRPADKATVDLALGRLAVVTEHYDVARQHAVARTQAAPESPLGFELLALVEDLAENPAAQDAALDEALRLGSQDPFVYTSKAARLILDNLDPTQPLDTAIEPGVARAAANLFLRSIALRSRNPKAYNGLGIALLNADVVTDQDAIVLSVGRLTLPTQGLIPIGQATVERRRGNTARALALLREALEPPLVLPAEWYVPVGALYDSWSSAPVAGDTPR